MEENPTKDLTLKLPRPCIFKGSEKQASNSHRRAVNQACAFPKWKHIGTVEGAVAPRKMRGQGAPPSSSFSLGPEKKSNGKETATVSKPQLPVSGQTGSAMRSAQWFGSGLLKGQGGSAAARRCPSQRPDGSRGRCPNLPAASGAARVKPDLRSCWSNTCAEGQEGLGAWVLSARRELRDMRGARCAAGVKGKRHLRNSLPFCPWIHLSTPRSCTRGQYLFAQRLLE